MAVPPDGSSEESDDKEVVEASASNSTEVTSKDKDQLKVYVGGLPFGCGKTDVREHFQKCGEIDWLHMPMDGRERSRGIAFISYWTQESVDAALKLNGSALPGTNFQKYVLKVNMAGDKPTAEASAAKAAERAKIKQDRLDELQALDEQAGEAKTERAAESSDRDALEPVDNTVCEAEDQIQEQPPSIEEPIVPSKDRKVFIGGVPFNCTKETLKTDFEACGPIQSFSMPTRDQGRSRGIAFATFTTTEGVAEALKFNDTDYGGCKLTVRMASEKVEKGKLKGVPRSEEQAKGSDGDANPLEVIVKGIGFRTKENALREWLLPCGTFDSLRMPVNKKGKSCGFAFVTFEDAKGVKRALKLSGSEFDGRPCQVERMGGGPAKHEEGNAPESEKVGSKKRSSKLEDEAEDAQAEQAPKAKKAKRAKAAIAG